jgi:energy-coupling factor transporter ATP-binding protein EcfA2
MASVNMTGKKTNPFPGLRPFTAGEDEYFFGRKSESEEIVGKLKKNRFVAVTGASGSGKSSLIYCGVIPEIRRQSLKESSWRVISIKPGNNPVANLAAGIVGSGFSPDLKNRNEEVIKILKENRDGIAKALSLLPVKEGERTLLVIDQFEELFRYGSPETGMIYTREASEFVHLLTNAITGNNNDFYTVIAIRTDFISECAQFELFTQLLNNSNFLVSKMTRENVREVITGPVELAGANIDNDLVEVLINDINERADQLPILQHALMRTWNQWQELEEPDRPIGLSDYLSIGTVKDAISRHADEEYENLGQAGKRICEKLFKLITGRDPDNKGIRYPANIKTIRSAIPCTTEELTAVVDKFRASSISIITPYYNIALDDDSIIDLSHEILIRLWERLKKWVDEEGVSVQTYLRLSESSALYQQGKAGLLKPPDLQLLIKWRDVNKPTLWWAQKYNPAYERAMVYLRTSEKEYLEAEDRKARKQRWRLNRIRIISSVLSGILILATVLLAGVSVSKVNADNKRKAAESEKLEIADQKALADKYAALALKKSIASDSSAAAAADREMKERELRESFENQYFSVREYAENTRNLQILAQKKADSLGEAGLLAEANVITVTGERDEIRRLRMISLAKSMSLRSLQIPEQKDLQALLAYQAYLFNQTNNGPRNDGDIYAGLYKMAKENESPHYRTFSGHNGQVRGIAFVPGTREFFTSGTDGKIMRWNLDTKEQSLRIVYSGGDIVEVLAVSPGADWLACGGMNADIKMIPLNGSDSTYELNGHSGRIRSLVFSFDGKSLYSAALDGKVLKWDLAARTSTDMATDRMQITSIDLSSNGRYLAGVSNEGKALVWDPENNSDRFRIESAGKAINTIRFKPGEEVIAVGYDDGTVEMWDMSSKEKTSEFMTNAGQVNDIRFNSKHLQMATTGSMGGLKIWDTGNPTALPVSLSENGRLVIAFEFSPDGEVILSGNIEDTPGVVGLPTYADIFAADGCNYVTRNFTTDEWLAYVGRDVEYEKTCPGADLKIRIREVKGD